MAKKIHIFSVASEQFKVVRTKWRRKYWLFVQKKQKITLTPNTITGIRTWHIQHIYFHTIVSSFFLASLACCWQEFVFRLDFQRFLPFFRYLSIENYLWRNKQLATVSWLNVVIKIEVIFAKSPKEHIMHMLANGCADENKTQLSSPF